MIDRPDQTDQPNSDLKASDLPDGIRHCIFDDGIRQKDPVVKVLASADRLVTSSMELVKAGILPILGIAGSDQDKALPANRATNPRAWELEKDAVIGKFCTDGFISHMFNDNKYEEAKDAVAKVRERLKDDAAFRQFAENLQKDSTGTFQYKIDGNGVVNEISVYGRQTIYGDNWKTEPEWREHDRVFQQFFNQDRTFKGDLEGLKDVVAQVRESLTDAQFKSFVEKIKGDGRFIAMIEDGELKGIAFCGQTVYRDNWKTEPEWREHDRVFQQFFNSADGNRTFNGKLEALKDALAQARERLTDAQFKSFVEKIKDGRFTPMIEDGELKGIAFCGQTVYRDNWKTEPEWREHDRVFQQFFNSANGDRTFNGKVEALKDALAQARERLTDAQFKSFVEKIKGDGRFTPMMEDQELKGLTFSGQTVYRDNWKSRPECREHERVLQQYFNTGPNKNEFNSDFEGLKDLLAQARTRLNEDNFRKFATRLNDMGFEVYANANGDIQKVRLGWRTVYAHDWNNDPVQRWKVEVEEVVARQTHALATALCAPPIDVVAYRDSLQYRAKYDAVLKERQAKVGPVALTPEQIAFLHHRALQHLGSTLTPEQLESLGQRLRSPESIRNQGIIIPAGQPVPTSQPAPDRVVKIQEEGEYRRGQIPADTTPELGGYSDSTARVLAERNAFALLAKVGIVTPIGSPKDAADWATDTKGGNYTTGAKVASGQELNVVEVAGVVKKGGFLSMPVPAAENAYNVGTAGRARREARKLPTPNR